MTFASLKAAVRGAVARIAVVVVSAFDIKLEVLIREFTRLDRALDGFVAAQRQKLEGYNSDLVQSFERQAAFLEKEEKARSGIIDKIGDTTREAARATRIKTRLTDLLD